MKISFLQNIQSPNVQSNKQNNSLSKKIDISHSLKSDTISFSGEVNKAGKNEELELCSKIIKKLYGEKAILCPNDDKDNFQRFYVSIKGEYREPATLVIIHDDTGKLKNITIQEHKESLWDIDELRVFDKQGQEVKHLSAEQAKTLRHYRGNLATNLNQALRYFDNLSSYQKDIGDMDSLFRDPKIYSTFDKDTVLYRGFDAYSNMDYVEENVGKTILEKGFLSTTTDKNRVNQYGNFYLKITVPKGTKYLDMPVLTSPSDYYIHESEVVLNRNSKLKITDYDYDTNTFSAVLVNE